MLDKELGKDVKLEDRANFLADNCDDVEEVTYSKPFDTAEMAEWREKLATTGISIADIEEEYDAVKADFKQRLKPLREEYAEAVKNVRNKACTVTETCYKFFDDESKMIGYYNANGDLINSRPAFPNEMGHSMFSMKAKVLRTGTNG